MGMPQATLIAIALVHAIKDTIAQQDQHLQHKLNVAIILFTALKVVVIQCLPPQAENQLEVKASMLTIAKIITAIRYVPKGIIVRMGLRNSVPLADTATWKA
jgi:hypothetical protein